MANATKLDSYRPRVLGKKSPEHKQINLWLGSALHCTSPYCATCGEWFQPTTPLCIFIDTLRHGLCHGCAARLTPAFAGIAAMAQNSPAKLCRQIAQTTGIPIGVISYCEAVIEQPAYIETDDIEIDIHEPVYTEAVYESSNVEEVQEKAQYEQ
jgi:hypothetical protein